MPAEKDTLFGELAVKRGYLTQAQLDEAREAQRIVEQTGVKLPLSQVLVGKKLLTEDQAQDLDREVAVQTGEARLVAGYEVVAKIGQGGMGAVYKARKLDSGEFVALKILLPSLATPEYVKRFERESKVVQKLDHENIVSCVEFGRDPKRKLYFCALELVEGEDVDKRVKRLGVLEEDEAISITYQVAKALQHAHFNGLVHRDIKPENIMVTADGTVKLLDLGLARPVSQEATRLTQSGMFVGSVYYASPEQAKTSKEIDIRADIYSLGATLYYMITGRPPFEGGSALMVLQQHVYEQIQWPAEINPAISDGLCRIVAKMMAKEPADRYQTPIDLLRQLDELKAGKRPEVGEKVMNTSTIARAGVRLKRRRARPASRARAAHGEGRERQTRARRHAPAAPKGVSTASALALLGTLAAAVVIVLAVVFTRGGKEEDRPKLPEVSARGHDTGAEPGVPSARQDATPEVHRTDAGRIVSPEARRDTRKVPPPSARAHSRRVPTSATADIRMVSTPGRTLTLHLGNNVTMEFVYIKPGVFMMGGDQDPGLSWQGVEKPKHEVAITRGFYMGRYEVTRSQFAAFVKATGYRTEAEKEGKSWGRHPDGNWREIKGASWHSPVYLTQTDDHPVVHVSWNDSKAFCDWLTEVGSRKGLFRVPMQVRLPTEAEWEFACRVGSTTRYCFGDNEGGLGEYAWYNANSDWQTHSVGRKKPNPWGLFDMHGNVWEWVADWYDAGYYANSPRENPTGPDTAGSRVLRGGSWNSYGDMCRLAFRCPRTPSNRHNYFGFRVAVSASPSGDVERGTARRSLVKGQTEPSPRGAETDLDTLLAEFDAHVTKGNHAGARRYAEGKAAKAANAARAEALRAAARVAKALEERREAIRRAAEALAGRETTLATGEGARKGEIAEVTDDGITLSMKIRRGRRVMGETRMTVKWSDLTPAEEDRLARRGGWKAEGAEGAMARAVLARSRGDLDAARAALEEAGDHPLAAPFRARLEAAEKLAAYGKAMRLARSHARAKRWKEAVKVLEEAGIREGEPAVPGGGSAGASPSHVALLAEAKKLLAEAQRHIPPDPTLTLDLGGNVTMELVYIKPGVFVMGGNEDPKDHWHGVEKPKHEVAIARGFYIGRYEVTRGQFAAFVKATGYRTEAEREGKSWGSPDGKWGEIKGASWRNPVHLTQTDDHPVVHVSWNDSKAFCDWATERTKAGTRKRPFRVPTTVRLPTEAEWEYACRAGSTTRWCFGDNEGGVREYAWQDKNSGWQTHPVGQKKPNPWGLFDIHGNVWEWAADWYDAGYYANSPRENPTGPDTAGDRVLRGGSWCHSGGSCRSAFRLHYAPSYRYGYIGFRLAAAAPGR